jgi:hypothetical protein
MLISITSSVIRESSIRDLAETHCYVVPQSWVAGSFSAMFPGTGSTCISRCPGAGGCFGTFMFRVVAAARISIVSIHPRYQFT